MTHRDEPKQSLEEWAQKTSFDLMRFAEDRPMIEAAIIEGMGKALEKARTRAEYWRERALLQGADGAEYYPEQVGEEIDALRKGLSGGGR